MEKLKTGFTAENELRKLANSLPSGAVERTFYVPETRQLVTTREISSVGREGDVGNEFEITGVATQSEAAAKHFLGVLRKQGYVGYKFNF